MLRHKAYYNAGGFYIVSSDLAKWVSKNTEQVLGAWDRGGIISLPMQVFACIVSCPDQPAAHKVSSVLPPNCGHARTLVLADPQE